MNKIIKKIGEQQQWYASEDRVFGEYEGFFVQMGASPKMESPNYKFILVRLPNDLEEEVRAYIVDELNKRKKELGFNELNIDGNQLYVQYIQNIKSIKEDKLWRGLETVITTLKAKEVTGDLSCSPCGATERVDIYHINNEGIQICDNCQLELQNAFQQNNKDFEFQETNYMQGFLGALLFSMGGVVLWVLVAVFLNYITTLGAFLIAFLSQIGYGKFNGKPDKNMKFFVISAGILAIIIANIATYVAQLMPEGFSLGESISLIFNDEYINAAFLPDLGISLFFGSIVWFFMLFDKGREDVNIIKAERLVG